MGKWTYFEIMIILQNSIASSNGELLVSCSCWLTGEHSCIHAVADVLFVCQNSILNHGYENHVILKYQNRNSHMMYVCNRVTDAKHLFPAVMFWCLGVASLFWTTKRQCEQGCFACGLTFNSFNINVFMLRKQKNPKNYTLCPVRVNTRAEYSTWC